MGKAVVITPIYLSFAWALMITYQLYTEIAVKTVMGEIMVLWPQLGNVLRTSVDLLGLYAFLGDTFPDTWKRW